jgi:hypothetical protein
VKYGSWRGDLHSERLNDRCYEDLLFLDVNLSRYYGARLCDRNGVAVCAQWSSSGEVLIACDFCFAPTQLATEQDILSVCLSVCLPACFVFEILNELLLNSLLCNVHIEGSGRTPVRSQDCS